MSSFEDPAVRGEAGGGEDSAGDSGPVTSNRLPSRGNRRRAIKLLTLASIAVTAAMFCLGIGLLLSARHAAWQQARASSSNLALALGRDIARNLSIYDLSLQGLIEALTLPGINETNPDIRHSALFDRAITAEYLGSMLVLDPAGAIVEDSTSLSPHRLNFFDRDLFSGSSGPRGCRPLYQQPL